VGGVRGYGSPPKRRATGQPSSRRRAPAGFSLGRRRTARPATVRLAVGRATRGSVVGKESCRRADDGSAARVTGRGCEGGRSGARPAAVGGRGLLADDHAVHPATGSNRNEERRRGTLLIGPERGTKYWNLGSGTAPGGGRRK